MKRIVAVIPGPKGVLYNFDGGGRVFRETTPNGYNDRIDFDPDEIETLMTLRAQYAPLERMQANLYAKLYSHAITERVNGMLYGASQKPSMFRHRRINSFSQFKNRKGRQK